ncbi:MAG: hypothetical protein R3337_00190 [Gammaproteobacteria bacterium]|nr:hypothetical protein [Gammaproteobacteria bacterium]
MNEQHQDDIIAAADLLKKVKRLREKEAKAMAESAERVRARYAEKLEKLAAGYSDGAREKAGV